MKLFITIVIIFSEFDYIYHYCLDIDHYTQNYDYFYIYTINMHHLIKLFIQLLTFYDNLKILLIYQINYYLDFYYNTFIQHLYQTIFIIYISINMALRQSLSHFSVNNNLLFPKDNYIVDIMLIQVDFYYYLPNPKYHCDSHY